METCFWSVLSREWEQKCVPGQCYQESENGNLSLVSVIRRVRMETCFWSVLSREWEWKLVSGQCYQESENGNLSLVSIIRRVRMETCPWSVLSGEGEWKLVLGQCSFSTMVLTISGFLLFNKVILCDMLNYHHAWQNCQYSQRTRFSLCDHLQIYPLTLSASRFLIPDFALMVPVLFLPLYLPLPLLTETLSGLLQI